MVIVVQRDLCGYGWTAADENYSGPPEHCGLGITQDDAVLDLLSWLAPDDDDLADVRVVVED
jgi:hypothetical protein